MTTRPILERLSFCRRQRNLGRGKPTARIVGWSCAFATAPLSQFNNRVKAAHGLQGALSGVPHFSSENGNCGVVSRTKGFSMGKDINVDVARARIPSCNEGLKKKKKKAQAMAHRLYSWDPDIFLGEP